MIHVLDLSECRRTGWDQCLILMQTGTPRSGLARYGATLLGTEFALTLPAFWARYQAYTIGMDLMATEGQMKATPTFHHSTL